MSVKEKSFSVKTIVQTSLLISLALVVRNFSYMVYLGGAPGIRVGFSGVFTEIAALLFGPSFGGIASGIVDLVGCIINPKGAYIPLLTVTAILGGVITAIIWQSIKKIPIIKLQRYFLLLMIIIGVLGITNHLYLFFSPTSFWSQTITTLGKYKDLTSIGLEIIAIIGFLFLLTGMLVKKKCGQTEINDYFLKVITATGVSGMIITTLNTFILRAFIPALGSTGFFLFWISRVIQEIFMTTIQAYLISILLSIYKNTIQNTNDNSTS